MHAPVIHLLLADDDKDDRFLFKDALNELPLSAELMAVEDGEELMQLLTKKEARLPDILFLDLNMPRKNGFECLSEIKQTRHLVHLPVIIFSTSFDPDIVEMLYKKGARYYIRKPNEFEKLKQIIDMAISCVKNENSGAISKENFVLQS